MGWTDAQYKAIHTPTGDGNLLVSAAAGSGKTAVLVERILQKIINCETTIDRLLVVTFTEAAASEMREKIVKQLIKVTENPDTDKKTQALLKSQIRLAETADIMTIDAFCMRTVQNNFHILGIDPNISIADSATSELLRAEAMNLLFDRLYKTTDEAEKSKFTRLTDSYSDNRSDTGLERVITFVHDFVVSFADPCNWLDEAAELFNLPAEQMPSSIHIREIIRQAARTCTSDLLEYTENNIPPAELRDYAFEMLNQAARIVSTNDYDEINKIYTTYFKSLSRKKQPDSIIQKLPVANNPEHAHLAEKLKFIRNTFTEQLHTAIANSPHEELLDKTNKDLLVCEAKDLSWIVREFIKEFAAVKEKRGVREFADIEQLTYTLFARNKDICEYYKNKYDEILIDEYQDTNGLQDSIFSLISHRNIFMVGDLKQSIYRFRGGDPYIFKEKSELYARPDSPDKKITLAQNFRSRQEILNSVNDIFSCIMSSIAGDVEYTGDELIVRDKERDYYPAPGMNCKSELHYISVRNDVDRNHEEICFVADKIAELLSSGATVFDKNLQGMRPLKKKDIVILENSVKSNGDLIVAELAKKGIDAFTETESFFSRREILVMLSLLSLISNLRQDVPLLTVMRSPIGGFSENELVRIRLHTRKSDCFISAVRAFAHSGGRLQHTGTYKFISGFLNSTCTRKRNKLAYKCKRFISDLNRWRGYMRTKSVAQLIWTLFEETYFYDIMGAIEQGEEAQFNLRLLYDRAKQFEKAGYKGLFNFIKYIENIESRNEDFGGAKLIGENHDVVRIMTIHKSKGLEFPVVFLMGAGKDFPVSSGYSTISLHKKFGYGLPFIYHGEHYMRDSKIKDCLNLVNKTELTSERMRLLYVALTRAREKLYVTVARKAKDSDTDILSDYENMIIDSKMPPAIALKARGFHSWICPAAYANPDTWDFFTHVKETQTDSAKEATTDTQEIFSTGDELKSAVYEILNYRYPYEFSNTIPSRTSVTQLKEREIERKNIYDSLVYEPDNRRVSSDDMAELMFSPLHPMPAFMRDEGDKPVNEIGTLYHLVMSEIDLDRIRNEGTDCVDDEIIRLVDTEIISSDDVKYIDADKIKHFYLNDIGKRLLCSKKVYREKPFQINISSVDYDPSLSSEYADESVILQGIIDCFFYENGGYVLVDYKTDKVGKNPQKIRVKYDKQLELYKKAIEKLTNIPVNETLLYLFDTDETV